MWDVVYLPEAEPERRVLPKVERNALIHPIEKFEAFGPQLGYPRTSAVQDSPDCGSYAPARVAARGASCIEGLARCS
ncbi:MAG: hypothetical protein ACR2LF_01845 [Jatrophihabitantaceae bacterium]